MVWTLLAVFVVSFFVGEVFAPKPKIENARAATLDDVQVARATAGSPVPYIFGRVRLRSPNVLWYGGFVASAQTEKVRVSVFRSKEIITGYLYYLGIDLGLCLGPGVVLRKIYVENKLLFSSAGGVTGGTQFSLTKPYLFGGPSQGGGIAGSATFYSGEFTQAANAYLTGQLGASVPGYVGVSHLVMQGVYIGTSPNLRQFSFEIERYPDNLGLSGSGKQKIGDDLNPMEILYDLLTEEWGGADGDPADLDTASFTAAATTLYNEGNGMSLLLTAANGAKVGITEVLRQVDGLLYPDPTTGLLTVKLIREDYTLGSLPVFDESDIELVTDWSHTDWSETINQVRATYTDRERGYVTSTAFAQDPGNIASRNRVSSTTVSFPGAMTGANAASIATRELSQLGIPLYRATLKMKRGALALTPGDVFKMSWADYNQNETVMRVQRFDQGQLAQGRVVMDVMQDRFAASVPLFSDPETSLWSPIANDAVDALDRNLQEVPYYHLTQRADWYFFQTTPEVNISTSFLMGLARPADSVQTAYDMVTSEDAFTIDIVYGLSQVPYPSSAVLTTKVLKEQGIRTGLMTYMYIQDLYPSTVSFSSATTAQIQNNGYNMLVVGNEIMAYESSTSLGGGLYRLNNVHRALLDTTFTEHAAGAYVYKLDRANYFTDSDRGNTATVAARFLSITKSDVQDVSEVTSVSATMNKRYNRPLPPDALTVASVRAPQQVLEQTSLSVTGTTRNRITPNTVVYVNDSGNTPETGTTYTARFLLNGVEKVRVENSALPISLTGLSGVGTGRIELGVYKTDAFTGVASQFASFTQDFFECWFGGYASLSSELLTNPNFEGTLTGWTTVSGSWGTETTAYPLDAFRSYPGYTTDTRNLRSTSASSELRQDFTIGAESGRAALLSAWKGGKVAGVTGQLVVELRDGGGALDTITTPLSAVDDLGHWERLEIPLPLRTDATTVRVRILGTAADSVWDNVSLRSNTVSLASTATYDGVTGLTVLGAWGLRLLVSGYSGPLVQVLDEYDNSTQDVGADPDGNLAPFFTRGTARVLILYDQSGNSSNLIPTAGTNMPRLVNMSTETGRPAIEFETGTNLRDVTAAGTGLPYMVARPCFLAAIGPKFGTANTAIFHIPHSDTAHTTPFYRWGLTTGASDWRYYVNATNHVTSGNGPSNSGKNVIWLDAQNGNFYHNNDATAADTFTAADTTWTTSRLRIGDAADGSLDWTLGTLYELVIFSDSGISAGDRQILMEGVADYWYNLAV